MTWYRKIKLKRSRRVRVRRYIKGKPEGAFTRRAITVHNPNLLFYKTFSRSVFVQGYRAKVISTTGISKFFGIPLQTIQKWVRAGLLPEPYMITERAGREIPFYLVGQIRCLAIVVRDLADEGYVIIPWQHLTEHVDMLHAGYAEVAASFQKRLGRTDKRKTFGVEFL